MFSRRLARSLLAWWDRTRVALPWREDRTPYSVWVSEVMLQQTVAGAVVPHFAAWTRAYSDVTALAAASEQEVTRLWEGLGYYSRARNVLRAARAVQERWRGELPATYEELRSLPGIGDYTARAILSIAHGRRFAVVDSNVRRVLQRLAAAREAPADREALKALEASMPAGRAGDFNEALMELGQRVCLKGKPRCQGCPLAAGCRARALGVQSKIPARKRAAAFTRESLVLILLRGDRVRLCAHRAGLFRGLWTFPRIAPPPGGAPALAASAGARVRSLGELGRRTHAYTRYREHLLPRVYAVSESARGFDGCEGEWVPLAALGERPMPSVYRRIANELLERIGELRR